MGYRWKPSKAAKKEICCICGKQIEGWGNNAEPVKDGRCCDDCNWEYVIPARMLALYTRRTQTEPKQE